MSKKTLQQVVDELPPAKALKEMAIATRRLLGLLDEKARLDFVMNLIGGVEKDKVASLVHL